MRISTSLIAAAVAGGTISLALQASEDQNLVALPPVSPSSSPTASSGELTAPPSAESEQQPSETTKPTNSEGTPAQPQQSSQKPTEQAPSQPVTKTVSSDPINYKYGVVQIQLTATDGKITDVSVIQGDVSYGRDAAYEALIQATIQVQGTNYGNVSGATFTTEAFKQAVSNALAKL